MNILVCFGTRPEWLKVKPLIAEFKRSGILHSTLFTGQHADLIQDALVNYTIDQKSLCDNRLNSIIANILTCSISLDSYTHVLVQGDTSSALAVALWAYNNRVQIIHLEAGLRTHNLNHPYPEEANRQLISRITDIHLCATQQNSKTLIQENVTNNKHIYTVGNTVLDNIVNVIPTYGNKVLITLHRRENHDIIDRWFSALDCVASNYTDLEFILPIHPNPNVYKYKDTFKHIKVIDPLDHTSLIDILKDCKFVITDSGGIQEEASFFNKRIIICRETTERSECLEHHGILCTDPSNLSNIVYAVNNEYIVDVQCPFGNGTSSKMISDILKSL